MSIPFELQIEIIKFSILEDFHSIFNLSLVCKSFSKTIYDLLAIKENRGAMMNNCLPRKFRSCKIFVEQINEIFDGRRSVESLKKLFIYVFRQKDNPDYIQYHKLRWYGNMLAVNEGKSSLSMMTAHFDKSQIFVDVSYEKTIKYFPLDLYNVANITALDLSCNELTEIPAEISKFKSLNQLKLHHNNLKFISPEIGKLKKLYELDVSYNKLTNLPSTIKNLKKLGILKCSFNPLSENDISI